MKNRNIKKSFNTFSKRNTHKRKGKEAAKRELLRAVMETGVSTDGAKVFLSADNGRRARITPKAAKSEIRARGIFSSSKSEDTLEIIV